MWTKKEDLQEKYVKLSSQQDYDTVVKVLHEFGFKMNYGKKNDKYYTQYPLLKATVSNDYYLYNHFPSEKEIPIQQFYDYLSSKTLKVEETIPEYVECVSWNGIYCKPGEIYPIIKYNSDITKCEVKSPYYDAAINCNNGKFKFSTKEAFDLQNQPKFEVGKWYKIFDQWYAKFNQIHGQGTFWQYTESITNKGNYDSLSHNLKMPDIKAGLKIELLTDLSEIQQYLPDGHVDKIKPIEKSLVGKYVKVLMDNCTYDIKRGDYLKIIDETANNLIYEKFGLADKPISKNFELMPEGFIPSNETFEWIPQVGDWVIAVTPELSYFCKALKNKAYKIKSIRASNTILELEGSNEIRIEDCKKALPHEIPNTTQEVKEMSKEELLDEAKRRYPVGCKVISTEGSRSIIGNHYFRFGSSEITKNNIFYDDGSICLYSKKYNKWAEIVSLPESKTIDLSNTKIRVDTPELSKLVQEKAFELGWEWCYDGKKIINSYGVYFYFGSKTKFINVGGEYHNLNNPTTTEIFPSDFGINVVNSEIRSIVKINDKPRNELDYLITPKQVIKSIFDKDFNNPLNEVLELPKSSKKKTKQLIY